MRNDTSLDSYYFHQGTNFEAYKFLGCNLEIVEGKYRYSFRTWAPNAHSVGLVSDFTGWDAAVPLSRVTDKGVWELIYESDRSLEKQAYKFRITSSAGSVDKGDPYARFSKGKADGASLIYTSSDFKWTDSSWLRKRSSTITTKKDSYIPAPINIYEVHLGSFMMPTAASGRSPSEPIISVSMNVSDENRRFCSVTGMAMASIVRVKLAYLPDILFSSGASSRPNCNHVLIGHYIITGIKIKERRPLSQAAPQ